MTIENKILEWDKSFIDCLDIFEKHSKCAAKKVACILVKNNNILSIGINGTLSGKDNCNEIYYKDDLYGWCKKTNYEDNPVFYPVNHKDDHHEWSLLNEIHAEINAIKKATQDGGFNIEGATAYISYSPCKNCAKTLALYGIKRIVYKEEYDNFTEIKKFLENCNIEVIKYNK